jgi:hypothetical protein
MGLERVTPAKREDLRRDFSRAGYRAQRVLGAPWYIAPSVLRGATNVA